MCVINKHGVACNNAGSYPFIFNYKRNTWGFTNKVQWIDRSSIKNVGIEKKT